MRTCSDCSHYYLEKKECEAPMPLWVENCDPLSHYHGDEARYMEPDHNADKCKVFRRRRQVKIED